MTCKTIPDVADRFLFLRNNTFYYRRRIPKEITAFEKRSRILCESLGTSNIYGTGGSLEWQQRELKKIELLFQ